MADDPDTVEFGLDFDDLPTSSLEPAELELVAVASAPDASEAVNCTQEVPEPAGSAAMAPASEADTRSAARPQIDTPSQQSTREIGPGAVLRNRYLIEKPLGVGGSSTVFSAVDRHRSESSGAYGRVAVKVLHPRFREDKARVFRLIREFRHMQRLTHAGIARVFDVDCDAGAWFITMELLEGQSLHRHLKEGLKEGEALRILTQCTEALAYAHDQGVMHGDLKPGNIFITHDGSVRLLDFGSVPDRDEAAATDCSSPNLAATLAYASPEMLEEKGIEPRDDLFSLGCVAYELFTGGQHPFDRKSSLEARRQNLRPADTRAIHEWHLAVIAQMLAWERAARPASARDCLQAFLTDFRAEVAPEITPSPTGTVFKSVAVDDFSFTEAGEAIPSDGAPTVPEPAATIGPEVHVDVDAETHAADAPGSNSDSHDPARADATPANPPPDLAAIEHTFAKFSGVVPDEWAGPGTPLPAVSRLQRRPADLSKAGPVKTAPARADSIRAVPNRTGANTAARERVDSDTSWIWSRKTVLLTQLVLVVLAAAILLSRLWQPETSAPVATVPAPAAKMPEPKATVAPPATLPSATLVQPSPEPTPPIAKSRTKAPARAAVAAPPPSGLASFQSALIRVGSSQQMAVVNVVREKSTAGSARVAWTIVGNTARPGVDYEFPDSRIVRFNDGQRVRSLYIPIKHPAGGHTAGAERRFTVKLQSTPGGLPPGRIAKAEVVINASSAAL